MHSKILKYLDEIAKQGSIRKAAILLNISSTSVNRTILQIEEQLGVRLFDRHSDGVELTPAGRILLEHSRQTLFEFDQVKAELEDIRDLRTGHLSIHTLDSVTFSLLPKVLDSFCAKFPGVSIGVRTARPERISEAVQSSEADIGISFTNDSHPDLRVFAEKATPFGAIMRPDHPLAERLEITLTDLVGYPLVRTADARIGHSIIDQEFENVALSGHIYTNALAVAKQAILSRQLVGIYTKIGFLREIKNRELRFVQFSNSQLNSYKVGVIVSAQSHVDPLKRMFISEMNRFLRNLNLEG